MSKISSRLAAVLSSKFPYVLLDSYEKRFWHKYIGTLLNPRVVKHVDINFNVQPGRLLRYVSLVHNYFDSNVPKIIISKKNHKHIQI